MEVPYKEARSNSLDDNKFEKFDIEEVKADGFLAKLFQFVLHPENLMLTVMIIEIVKVMIILIFNFSTEMGHANEMMYTSVFHDGEFDYNHIFDTSDEEEAYPAIGLYIGFIEYYYLSRQASDDGVAQTIGAIFHIAIMWCVVRIYQNAFHDEPKYARIVLLFSAMLFPSAITVAGASLDSKALFFCLLSIVKFQNGDQLIGIIIYSIAFSIKMEAIYFLPSICYLMAISSGQFIACCGLLLILLLQATFAFPFIVSNPKAYFLHSYVYNFRRAHDTSTSMTWGFLPQFIGYNTIFLILLTLLHGSILKFMLFCRLLKFKTIFKDLDIWPLNLFPHFRHQRLKFITEVFFFLFFAGMVTMKGANPQTMIWWIYSIPFLLHSIGYNFTTRGYKFMFILLIIIDSLYMLHNYRV